MNKQPEITAQTKQNFVDAFWELYKKNNIENITIKQITDKAGYNRSSFYRYFKDVYDVLEHIENTLIENIKTNIIRKHFNLNMNQILINDLAHAFEKYGEYFSILFGENGDPYFVKKYKSIMKSEFYSLLGLKKSNNELDIIFEFSISAMIGALTFWYSNKDNMSSEEFLELIRSIIANGTIQRIEKFATSNK